MRSHKDNPTHHGNCSRSFQRFALPEVSPSAQQITEDCRAKGDQDTDQDLTLETISEESCRRAGTSNAAITSTEPTASKEATVATETNASMPC